MDLDYDDMDGEEEEDEEGESSDEEVPELVEEVNSKKSKRKLEASPEVGHLSKKQKVEIALYFYSNDVFFIIGHYIVS